MIFFVFIYYRINGDIFFKVRLADMDCKKAHSFEQENHRFFIYLIPQLNTFIRILIPKFGDIYPASHIIIY